MTSHDQDYLNSVAQRVITDEKDHHSGLKTLHDEIDKLRSQDKSDDDFRKDLSLLGLAIRRDASASHLDGILPRIDLVEDNKRDGVIRLLSGDDDPTDGKGNRIKSAHGETFKYDKDGHLQEFTENHGKDVWKYNADDGKYDLYRNGKKTAESSDDAVVVDDDRGNITRYHSDGSSTSVSHAGRTDRNADGNITYQDLKGGRVRKIEYDGAHPTRITEFDSAEDAKNGKAASIYEYDSDSKKWYRLDNNEQPDKSDPVDIDLDQRNGSEKLTHADGTSQQFFRGGAEIDRDKDNRVSRVEHSNGSVSDNFTYGDDGQLTGFSTHDKNGRNGHRYEVDKDGNLKKDGEVIGKGKISIDDNGEIKVENKGKKRTIRTIKRLSLSAMAPSLNQASSKWMLCRMTASKRTINSMKTAI
jgi:hypothetical protein